MLFRRKVDIEKQLVSIYAYYIAKGRGFMQSDMSNLDFSSISFVKSGVKCIFIIVLDKLI